MGFVAGKIQFPWYWSEFILNGQDLMSLQSGAYLDCKTDKLFTTASELGSVEGIVELGARGIGSPFEILAMLGSFSDRKQSTQKKGAALGKVTSSLLDFKI